MALTKQRHKEIDEELRLMTERLLALTDELAATAAPENDYEIISTATELAARQIAYVQRLMKFTLRYGGQID